MLFQWLKQLKKRLDDHRFNTYNDVKVAVEQWLKGQDTDCQGQNNSSQST